MSEMNQSAFSVLFLVLTAALLGCGPSGPKKYSVQGKVTFDGEQIPKGNISFVPLDSSGCTAATKIVDGNYATEARTGKYKVVIQASREYGPVIPSMGERARRHYIPRKFNLDTTLNALVEPEDNTFEFNLEP